MGKVTEVEIINKKTGETKILFEREGSYCHFMDEFCFGRFLMQLRLDWTDQDSKYQEPTLDADIYTKNKVTGEKIKYKSGKHMWHHTSISKDKEGNLIYHFSFKSLELILRRRITVEDRLDGKVRIIDSRVGP
jgi:hypothetical protein